jgi:two-component system CheB/CheR fusion protein
MPDCDSPRKDPLLSPVAAGLPNITPDLVEQEVGEEIDNIVPTYGYQQLPMVGIGGSAGSIRALQAFFEQMPPESGLVFVVIMHLSPDHISAMPEMIQKWTRMQVLRAIDGARVEANRVYVIPPGKHLTASNGHLKLTDLDRDHGRRVAVDLFFRSLADTHGPHAAAIVLSGADADGAVGVRRIKERGGLTIAQDPNEAEHDSMPRAAIDSGMVDWVLSATQMPQRILDYIALEDRLKLPSEEGPQPAAAPRPVAAEPEEALREILVFLRTRTGRDFSYYKRATIVRRISRRMQVNGVADMMSYLALTERLGEPRRYGLELEKEDQPPE